ncbi:hypothetical protein P3S67_011908 [Capsicum chacoense]
MTFPHLYVLDLENIPFDGNELPDAIGNLVHLKLLGLSNTNVFGLPLSIGKLKRLQTLEALIGDHCSCKLPPQVAQLTSLRHLVARYEVPLQVDRLTNLRTLKYICCDQWKNTDASGLVNLQELGMEKIWKSYSLKSIGNLKSLTTLFLVCQYGELFPPLEPLSSCQNLQRLWLSGEIEELADLNNLPKCITLLVLQSAGLKEDPMPILGKFPNLKNLELSRAYEGKNISCKGNDFGQLEILRLYNLKNLESWHLDGTVMSLIKSLSILECPKLMEIPEQMKHVAVFEEQSSDQTQWAFEELFPSNHLSNHEASAGTGFLLLCNLNNFRTKFIFGSSLFQGFSLTQYFSEHHICFGSDLLHTYSRWFNDTMSVIFTSHTTIAAMVAVFLDQTLPFSNDEAQKDNGYIGGTSL